MLWSLDVCVSAMLAYSDDCISVLSHIVRPDDGFYIQLRGHVGAVWFHGSVYHGPSHRLLVQHGQQLREAAGDGASGDEGAFVDHTLIICYKRNAVHSINVCMYR
jgi:hypothetical protein